MRDLLIKMGNGWRIYNESWNGERHERDAVDCMVEACGGDEKEGYMLHLFDYWSNDIMSMAPYFGVLIEADEKAKITVRRIEPEPWVSFAEQHEQNMKEMSLGM